MGKTRQINDLLRWLRACGVRLENPDKIRRHLLAEPMPIEAVAGAVASALGEFSEAEFELEVYEDPELRDQHLVLNVRFETYANDLMDRIRAVREQCRDGLHGERWWLHLTTDFRKPKRYEGR